MNRRQSLAAVLASLAAGVLFTACTSGSSSNTRAQIRFVNLLADQPGISVTVGDTTVASGVAYQAASSFAKLDSNTYTTTVSGAGGTALSSFSQALGQKHYTTYLYGTGAALHYATLDDDAVTVSADKFVVRTLLASAVSSNYDLYLTATDTDLATVNPTLYATGSGTVSAYSSELTSGSYRLRLTQTGTKNVVFDTTQDFAAKTATTLVFHSAGSSVLPTLLRVPQDATAAITALPGTLARVRMVFGTPDAALSRLAIDGATAFQSVPFGGVTNFITQATGAHQLALFADDGATATASLTATLSPGHDYTIVSRGPRSAASLLLFDENANDANATATAFARFVNATADQPAIDVVVNYQALIANLGAGTRSSGQSLEATTYPLSYYASGGALLAAYTTDTLVAGGDYRFLLIGGGGQYLAVAMRND